MTSWYDHPLTSSAAIYYPLRALYLCYIERFPLQQCPNCWKFCVWRTSEERTSEESIHLDIILGTQNLVKPRRWYRLNFCLQTQFQTTVLRFVNVPQQDINAVVHHSNHRWWKKKVCQSGKSSIFWFCLHAQKIHGMSTASGPWRQAHMFLLTQPPPPIPAGPSTPSPQSFHLQQQCKCCKIPHILRETWNKDHYDIISNDITGKFSNYSASHNQLEEFATD